MQPSAIRNIPFVAVDVVINGAVVVGEAREVLTAAQTVSLEPYENVIGASIFCT